MRCSIGELEEAQETGPNSKGDYNQVQGSPMKNMIMERQHDDTSHQENENTLISPYNVIATV